MQCAPDPRARALPRILTRSAPAWRSCAETGAQPAESERRPATAISSRPAPANRRNLQDVIRRLMSR
jgi:hypothetical protein